ncbi:hypothetical protein SynBIOSE41_02335 [Synechococcus sp. BIOS-E4-1]|nr:hypothetical protein SynBIOSE41_02335 [Synechococcus sp. BIOS-E4-1]
MNNQSRSLVCKPSLDFLVTNGQQGLVILLSLPHRPHIHNQKITVLIDLNEHLFIEYD